MLSITCNLPRTAARLAYCQALMLAYAIVGECAQVCSGSNLGLQVTCGMALACVTWQSCALCCRTLGTTTSNAPSLQLSYTL